MGFGVWGLGFRAWGLGLRPTRFAGGAEGRSLPRRAHCEGPFLKPVFLDRCSDVKAPLRVQGLRVQGVGLGV